MPFQCFDRHHDDRYYKAGYTHHVSYSMRDRSRSTRYVINEGRLVVDDRSRYGSKSNTVIYNAPGSSMRIESRHGGERYEPYWSSYRGRYCCYERCCGRDCFGCVSISLESPRYHDVISVRSHRLLD